MEGAAGRRRPNLLRKSGYRSGMNVSTSVKI
jgi:hypothetical protein